MSVNASNTFGSVSTKLCPQIIVLKSGSVEVNCEDFQVSIVNKSTPDQPISIERSDTLTFHLDVITTCDNVDPKYELVAR